MSSSSSKTISWIQWFCSNKGNEYFVEIDENYIADAFNLTGLGDYVPHFRAALDKIMDYEHEDCDTEEETDPAVIEMYAERLYGLVHARYVLTGGGMEAILEKYEEGVYGTCPRVFCEEQHLLPIGLSDILDDSTVKLFCPLCEDIYCPKQQRHRKLPGAYFGTSLPQMLMMVHTDLRRKRIPTRYEPRLYGFRVHPSALKRGDEQAIGDASKSKPLSIDPTQVD